MSRWIDIIERHREEHQLGAWNAIPESHYPSIAKQCGASELEDIRERLDDLDRQAAEIPDWDGDAQDSIWRARRMFASILRFRGHPGTGDGTSA